jgi:dihydropteroate synthase
MSGGDPREPREPRERRFWTAGPDRVVSLDPFAIMGVVNATPDSFSDGGQFSNAEEAAQYALQLVEEGATIIDIGGESTRPGAARVDAEEQVRRVVPVIARVRSHSGVAISVDTTLAAVAEAALEAGADIVNDVSAACEDPAMLPLVARKGAGLILMHRLAPPGEDSYPDRYAEPPIYDDVVREVASYLLARADIAIEATLTALGHAVTIVGDGAAALARAAEGLPLGRIPTPEDFAHAAVFLASEEARAITGHMLMVDCGASAGKF